MEREQDTASAADGAGESPQLERLRHASARVVRGAVWSGAYESLKLALKALVSPDERAATAALLRELLAAPTLTYGLCRRLAVQRQLSLGYPWALEVDPDDLELFRAHQHQFKRWVLGGIAAVGLSFGALALVLSVRNADVVPADPAVGRAALAKCYSDMNTLTDEQYFDFMREANARLTHWVVARSFMRLNRMPLGEVERAELCATLR